MIRTFHGFKPTVPTSCFIEETGIVIVDAVLGEHRSVYFHPSFTEFSYSPSGDGSDRHALMPLGATLSEFAEGNPSEIPSRTQSVSAFFFGKFSKGPRSFGKTLRDLTYPRASLPSSRLLWHHAPLLET